MNAQQQQWKDEADALWAAARLDYAQAVRLVAEIARQDGEGSLQRAAVEGLPSLRRSIVKKADHMTLTMARQRFSAVRDALHALAGPRFGKRRDAGEFSDSDESHRRTLGLPARKRLFGPEINEAYKRAAKKAHPDAGGSERAFREVSAARDALLKDM